MTHPYKKLPDRNFWNRTVSSTPWQQVFASEQGKFQINADALIATAGSCFAQRISAHLRGFNFGRTLFETPHPLMDTATASSLGYDTFSARYGNIYTTRQLRQVIDEAFGIRPPLMEFAQSTSGKFIDLLRPGVHGEGFTSLQEAQADRAYHVGRVREMFVQANVFIFTLGLTEAWAAPDGTVFFGTHPNVSTGKNVRDDLVPINFDYIDCFNDLAYVINLLRSSNASLQFILTVSPVALAATHQDRHVALATSYSKSVLRAVAGRVSEQLPFVDYFMSYEIFSCAQSFGQFLSENLRDVSPRGVGIAMRLFEDMYCSQALRLARPEAVSAPESELPIAPASDTECEEILNAVFQRG